MNGFLLLDKPNGITSHLALRKAKYALGAKKAGHTGSLDPLATGMLPLCFGEATKFSRFLLAADKCYQVEIQLGVTTTTGDSEGDIIATSPLPPITDQQIEKMLLDFQGEQQQIPPMYSALKHKGQPLYKMARLGKVVAREPRRVIIYELCLNERREKSLLLTVVCSKGTYIRTLAEEIGKYLGCGAHVIALHRVWVAPFQSYPMHALTALTSAALLTVDAVLSLLFPVITCSNKEAFLLQRGQIISCDQKEKGWVALKEENGLFLGVGEANTGILKPRRLVKLGAFSNEEAILVIK